MSKLIGLAFAALLLLASANPIQEKFAKYKAIEAYEIRPGVLMMPSYSSDGQVCEIGLEKRHYSPEMIRPDPSLSRKEIDQILDELVPADERGPRSKDIAGTVITREAHSVMTQTEFENVSITIYGAEMCPPKKHEISDVETVATVQWKHRKCQ